MILTITSLKGGVGKTTISGLLSLYMAYCRQSEVVLIDLDPQMGSTSLFLSRKSERESSFDLLEAVQSGQWAGGRLREALCPAPTSSPGASQIYLIGGDPRLAALSQESLSPEALRVLLEEADLPPSSLTLIDTGTQRTLVELGIQAADRVLIPLMLSQQTIKPTVNTLAMLQRAEKPLLGLIPLQLGKAQWEAKLLDGWARTLSTRFPTLRLVDPDEPIFPALPYARSLLRGQWAASGFPERFFSIFQIGRERAVPGRILGERGRDRMKGRDLLEEIELDDGEALPEKTAKAGRKGRAVQAILEVPLSEIVETGPYQTRQVAFDPSRYPEDAELLSSVQQFGVIEPVLIQALPTGLGEPLHYRLMFGNRRVAAARAAGRESVPALLATREDDVDAFTIVENSGRRNLTPYEKALILVHLKEQSPEVSVAELASKTGWPQPTIYSLLASYEKSVPALRRLFAEGQSGPRAIQTMQPLFSQVKEEQHEVLAALLSERTLEEIEQVRASAQTGQDPITILRSTADVPPLKKAIPPQPQDPPETHVAPSAPGALDPNALQKLTELTGASRAVVTNLVQPGANPPYPVLFLACRYIALGGDEAQALSLAEQALAKRGAGGMLRQEIKRLTLLPTQRRWIADLPNRELKQFLGVIFGG